MSCIGHSAAYCLDQSGVQSRLYASQLSGPRKYRACYVGFIQRGNFFGGGHNAVCGQQGQSCRPGREAIVIKRGNVV